MYLRHETAFLPQYIKDAIQDSLDRHDKRVECMLANKDKVRLISDLIKQFPDLIKRPDGSIGYSIYMMEVDYPDFTIYCCVSNFSDVDPIADVLNKAGYTLDPEYIIDTKWNMSRTVRFENKSNFWDHINLVMYALKELGSDCRAVSMGYDDPYKSTPVEKFKLVCDDLTEVLLKQDIQNPNYL